MENGNINVDDSYQNNNNNNHKSNQNEAAVNFKNIKY